MRWSGLAQELKGLGIEVKAVEGWKGRGLDYPFDPDGAFNHHTGSNKKSGNVPSLGICTHGRSGIPGPLCQIVLARNGTVFLVAQNRANHAGTGGPWRWVPRDSGNTFAIGIEWENDGVGEKYGNRQMEVGVLLNAVLLRRMGRGVRRCGSHKEYTSRKIDPSFDMKRFRKKVKKALAGAPKPKPKPKPKKNTKGRWPKLQAGSKGRWVRKVQRKLRRHGAGPGPVDGDFGKRTEKAVRRFQRAESLKADGVVGKQTWKRLRGKG